MNAASSSQNTDLAAKGKDVPVGIRFRRAAAPARTGKAHHPPVVDSFSRPKGQSSGFLQSLERYDEAAFARRHASARANSSIRLLLTGGAVGWIKITSLRHTGSSSRTDTSPSGKRSIAHALSGTSSSPATA